MLEGSSASFFGAWGILIILEGNLYNEADPKNDADMIDLQVGQTPESSLFWSVLHQKTCWV